MKINKKRKKPDEPTIYGTIAWLSLSGFLWSVIILIAGLFFYNDQGYPFDHLLGMLLGIMVMVTIPLVVARRYLDWPWYIILSLQLTAMLGTYVLNTRDIFSKKHEPFNMTGFVNRRLKDLQSTTSDIVEILSQVNDAQSAVEATRKLEGNLSVLGGVMRSSKDMLGIPEQEKASYRESVSKQLKSSAKRLRTAVEKVQKHAQEGSEFQAMLNNYLRLIKDMESW